MDSVKDRAMTRETVGTQNVMASNSAAPNFPNRVVIRLLFSIGLIALSLSLDAWAVEQLARPIHSGQLQGVLRALRCWGEGATVVILSAGIGLATRRWRQLAIILLATLASATVVDLLKPLIGRRRPAEVAPIPPSGAWQRGEGWNSSFPSGHSATAFAFASGISLAFPAVRPVCLVAACGTAFSRMYEERHFFSDCVAGGLLGWNLTALIWARCNRRLTLRLPSNQGHALETSRCSHTPAACG